MAWRNKDFLGNYHAFPEFVYGLANEPVSFRNVLMALREEMKDGRVQLLVGEQLAHLDRDEIETAATKFISAFGKDDGIKAIIVSIGEYVASKSKPSSSQQQRQQPPHAEPSRVDPVPPPPTPVPMPPRVDPLPLPTYTTNPPPPAFNVQNSMHRDAALAQAFADGVLRDILNRLIQTCRDKELGLDNGDSLEVSAAQRSLERNRPTDCCHAISGWADGRSQRAKALALALSEQGIPTVFEKKRES